MRSPHFFADMREVKASRSKPQWESALISPYLISISLLRIYSIATPWARTEGPARRARAGLNDPPLLELADVFPLDDVLELLGGFRVEVQERL